jgi:hypothetical protein
MPELKETEKEISTPGRAPGRHFMRFTRAQRYLHAVLFTTFLGLAGTGLPLRFRDSF